MIITTREVMVMEKSVEKEVDKLCPGPFGVLLRRWRRVRGMSQLGLASLSNTSSRHISFLETGRARPGRDLITELANALSLSLRDINAMLTAAGFPPMYPEDDLNESEGLEPFRALIGSLVHGNPRTPCFVVDRWWRIQNANIAMKALFQALGTHYKIPDDKDVIDRILGNSSQLKKMLNFDEVVRNFTLRLRSETSLSGLDEAIESLAKKAEDVIDSERIVVSDRDKTAIPLTFCPQFQVGDDVYTAVVGISRFGAAPHVGLSELRLIWLMPENERSEQVLRKLMQNYNPSC